MVKVKINENESYEIAIPQELDMGQLIGIVERLKLITKMSQNEFMPQVLETPKLIKAKREYVKKDNYILSKKATDILSTNRSLSVEFIRLYYLNNEESMNTFLLSNGLEGYLNSNRTWFSKKVHQFRKKWSIEPKEVGITAFPVKAGRHYFEKNITVPQDATTNTA